MNLTVFRLFILLIIIVMLFPIAGSALQLREIHSIPLEDNVKIHGLSTNNIILQYDRDLIFYNRRWQVRDTLRLDQNSLPVVAESGQYYCIVEQPDSNSAEDSAAAIFTVYDIRKVPLWGGYDLVSGQYFLSPDGTYLLAVSGTPGHYDFRMHLYHRDRPVEVYDIEYFNEIIFSADGQYFMVDCRPKNLRLFGANEGKITEWPSQRISIFDQSNNWTAHCQGLSLRIFDGAEEKMNINLDDMIIKDMMMSVEAERLALVYGKNLRVVDLEKGSTVWEYPPGKEGGTYTCGDISTNNSFIACGVDINLSTAVEREKRHVTGYLFLYDIDANTREKMKFEYDDYAAGLPRVKFLPDNRTIAVQTKEKLHFVIIH